MPAMGTVARSGMVWERGRGGRGEIGPQRPQICPLSDSGRLGGARVAAGVRRALRAAVSVPRLRRGSLAGRRAAGAAPAPEPTVLVAAAATAAPRPALCRMVSSGGRAMGCRGEALTARKRSLHKCAFAPLRGCPACGSSCSDGEITPRDALSLCHPTDTLRAPQRYPLPTHNPT